MVCICTLTYGFVAVVGALTTLKFLYQLYIRFCSAKNKDLVAKYGKGWCLVTGATDGIGRGFSEELAKQGFNVCVFGRSEEKTARVCKEIEELTNKKVKVAPIIADFKDCITDVEFIEKIKTQVSKVVGSDRVSILVNNVGIERVGGIRDKSQQWYRDHISINIGGQTLMTKYVIDEYMKEKSSQKQAIVNLSSFVSETVIALDAEYCGSKSYNDKFSRSLEYELADDNIDVLSVRPLFVTTPLTGNLKGNGAIPPSLCARESLKHLGVVSSTNGAPSHNFQSLIVAILPEFLVVGKFHNMYKAIIRRVKRKQQQKREQQKKDQ